MRDEIYYDRLDQVHAQMKSINIFYPAGQTVTEQDKEHLGLQYCTWIPYTGSLDDPEALMASEELQAAVGADGFSDGLSEAETGTAEPEVTEEQAQPEEVIISDEEESTEDGNSSETGDADDNGEISVEEEFGDGEELIINEIEKPVFEAAENFTSGSAVLELNAAGEAVSGVIQKQTYTGLVENSNCFFAVVRDKESVDFFAPSNLLFMTQAVSDDDGNLSIEYCTADNTGIPVLYGAEKSLDLSNAEIIVEEGLAYTGQEQKPAVKKSVMKLNASSLVLRKKQKTSALTVSGMVSGDYVKAVTSGNKKFVKVVRFTKNGKITLQAQKKTGKTTLTIQLANGAKKTIKVKVQAGKVKTSKISITKKVRIKKGKKLKLKPALTPITSQEKITFTSSNKKVVTVTSKGVIKAKKKGKATITVKSGKKTYRIKVAVK